MSRRRLEAAIRNKKGSLVEKQPEFTEVEVFKEIPFPHDDGGIYSLQFSFDAKSLAVGYKYGGIQLFSTESGDLLHDLRDSRLGREAVMCMRFHPDNESTFLATTADGLVLTCDTDEGVVLEVVKEPTNEINVMDFCLDGQTFATGGTDLAVRLYDSRTMQLLYTYGGENSHHREEGCMNRIYALKFSPDNNDIFVTGGWDDSLKIFDKRSKQGVRRSIPGPHICGDALDLKQGKILTGSWVSKNSLQVWNYSEGSVEKNVPFPNEKGEYLYCAQFCDNDVVLAGGSGTNSVQAIHYPTGKVVGNVQMEKPVHCIDSVHGGRMFAVGSCENVIKLVKMS